MENNWNGFEVLAFFVIGALIGALICGSAVHASWQNDLLLTGHAHYVLDDPTHSGIGRFALKEMK